MCGITAIFAYDQSAPHVDERELRIIRDSMTARGPDGAGEWFDPQQRIGLAHRRLSIIDLSPLGAQPMLSADGMLAIVFNGEIYNYRELKAGLESQGKPFRSQSDTEVLLHLYAQHGEAMVEKLRGMYAFAIWDQNKRGLFLARDPYGIKPLYLADDGKTLRVASQVKALLAGGKVDKGPDPAGHVGFFLWGHLPEAYTLFRSIRSLPAGTTLWVSQGGSRQQRKFCSVSETYSLVESDSSHRLSQSSTLESPQPGTALRDSIAHHLIADVPVGVFLSSGLDSTSIAALAAEQGGTLRTVTLGFEEFKGTPNDEVPLAESVARQLDARHQTIWVTRTDFQTQRAHLFAAMDQPTIDGVNTYFVSLAAKRASLKVALSGLGGDELFGGYPSFAQIPRAVRRLKPFANPVLRPFTRAFRAVSAPVIKHFTSPKYAGLLEYGGSCAGAYLLRRGLFMPWELPDILDADLVRQGWAELQPLVRLDETLTGIQDPWLKVACLESCWYLRNQLLRDADWAGMAHSLEIRVPLVDVTLLRALSPLLARPSRPTKRDMAQSLTTRLPPSILNRPKTGFTIPVRDWLVADNSKSDTGKQKPAERGLRGWAREVYGRFREHEAMAGTLPDCPQSPILSS
ncbi:MAG: asparagine synthase (glutamine-hydrolyzing) [Verrucomicrobia bacterium]|nr:asparagine synthase (glutamine-hydrolyzing) [Verrucomicrobiota bacterium]